MATRNMQITSVNSAEAGKPSDILFLDYKELDGDSAENKHMRREFCSQLVDLPFRLQEMVLSNQSSDSLERLITTLKRFKSPDTGYLTHASEINIIENEINSRGGRKRASSKEIMNDLRCALDELSSKSLH